LKSDNNLNHYKIARELKYSKTIPDQYRSALFYSCLLAHHINFYDNKSMINKFKDFLKRKTSKETAEDLSDQDDHLEVDELEAADNTGEYEPAEMLEAPPSFKNKMTDALSRLKLRIPSFRRPQPYKQAAPNDKKNKAPLLSPNFNQQIEKFLARSNREPIHQVAIIVLICAVTYSLGKISALVMRGTPTLDSARDYTVTVALENDFNVATLGQVRSINIFRTNVGVGKKRVIADKKCDEAEQSSNLPIKLVNTIVLQDSVKSLASVQVRGNRDLQEVREGEQISNLAKIFKISRLGIVVKNLENGMCESITSDKLTERASKISVMSPAQSTQYKLAQKLPGIENVGNKFVISKTLLDEKMKDIGAILTQARAIQIQNPDGTLAFKMTEIDPQGIFPYLGIQDQDIITSINGKPIYDMNEVMLLFGRIKGLDNLSLGIKREGSDTVQEYSIKK
jgi:type II secretory pathway component PulC